MNTKTTNSVQTFDHNDFIVTTSIKPQKEEVLRAIALSKELKARYVSRRSFNKYKTSNHLDFYYVVEKDGLRIRWKDGEFFFHPSSSKMRMRNIRNNQRDHLIEAMNLKGNEVVYDLTLGLGSEAILIAAHLTTGKVVGVEASKHIYTIVKYGIQSYEDQSPWVNESFKRIELIHSDYKTWIKHQEDNSCDYCYCDPMFDNPVMTSSGFNPLRPFAVYDKVSEADIQEMKRISRKSVILKALSKDSLFSDIQVDEIRGSRTSGVLYGVIDC
ncbi:MAG: class I SAM-dependent methyltransferase [Thermotogota bacterium]